VYHDVTNRRWAEKALEGGVDGLICVNNRAGGHAGSLSPQQLLDELAPLQKPLICAGGIGDPEEFSKAIRMGYSGAQSGTRFIATRECNAHPNYKSAILHASEQDIVLSKKISGVPVAIIRTPYIERIGTTAGPIAKWLLKGRKTKHWMRAIYSLQSIWKLKYSSMQGTSYKDYFQAGKSVSGIQEIQSAAAVVSNYAAELKTDSKCGSAQRIRKKQKS